MVGHKSTIYGIGQLPTGAVPDRSPGPLGWQDAADPNAPMCLAGDTPGPAGTGGDMSALICESPIEARSSTVVAPVLEVDLGRVSKFLYTVAFAESQDFYAKLNGDDVELGSTQAVDARAKQNADALLNKFMEQTPLGPDAVVAFLEQAQKSKDQHIESLKKKFRDARNAGERNVALLGGIIKGLSVVKFGSTVFIKVASLFAPPAGAAIDISYDVAQSGVDAAFDKDKKVVGVVLSTTGEELVKELGENLNEMAGDGLLSRQEADLLKDSLKKYKADNGKLIEQMEKIEQRLSKAMEGSKKYRKTAKQYLKQVEKVKALRVKAAKGLGKKAVGKVLSVAFVAADIKEAWGGMTNTWRESD